MISAQAFSFDALADLWQDVGYPPESVTWSVFVEDSFAPSCYSDKNLSIVAFCLGSP